MEKIGVEVKERKECFPPGRGLPERVWKYMQEQKMTVPGDRLVLGVSGGGDSMALLHVLLFLREKGQFTLAVVHVNHGIRGQEADEDQAFVENYCKQAGIFCKSVSCHVKKLAKEASLSEEEAGRMARRAAMEELCREWKGTKMVLAHHRDDLAETVLYHLARGSSLRGLSGIQPVNGKIIRPFLGIEQREIVYYLEEQSIPYRTDCTNLTDDYTRNKIRHHVMPFLKEQVNEGAVKHICSLAELSGEADEYLASQGRAHLQSCSQVREGGLWLSMDFFQAPHIVKLYGLAEAVETLVGRKKDLTREKLEGVLRLYEKPVGKWMPFYGGYGALRQYDGVLLTKEKPESEAPCQEEEILLNIPGVTRAGEGEVFCRLLPWTCEDIVEKKYTKWMDYDKISGNLSLRRRRAGDYITVTKEGGKKKLKDWFINEKIPQKERNTCWLLADGPEILWVIGRRMGEACKITNQTRRILEITYKGGVKNE